jgi:hypothetical protein
MVDGDRKSIWEHERDEARRKERELAKVEEIAKEVPDLQKDATRSAQEVARNAEAHERTHGGLDQERKRRQRRSLDHGRGL